MRIHQVLASVAFLKSRFGSRPDLVAANLLDLDFRDANNRLRAAKAMAKHAGLKDLLFVISVGRMNPRQGGNIELATGQREVFIDISKAAGRFNPSLLAVLAHELSHKVLFDNGIHQGEATNLEYEILTDVTAIHLGFGKLLLNGYEYRTSRRRSRGFRRGYEERTTTRRFGYVTREEIAFLVLHLYCSRDYPSSQWAKGLSPNSKRLLQHCWHREDLQWYLRRAKSLAPQHSFIPSDQVVVQVVHEA